MHLGGGLSSLLLLLTIDEFSRSTVWGLLYASKTATLFILPFYYVLGRPFYADLVEVVKREIPGLAKAFLMVLCSL